MSYIYDLTDTWTAAGTTWYGIKMNVTNTASAAASKLISLQIGGTDKFTVDKDGDGYFAGSLGVGTSSVDSGSALHVQESDASLPAASGASAMLVERAGNVAMTLGTDNTGEATIFFGDTDSMTIGRVQYGHADNSLGFWTNGSERARIDSSGNLLVGATSTTDMWNGASSNPGTQIEDNGGVIIQKNSNPCLFLSKASGYTNSNFGSFYVNGTNVGTITTTGSATAYNTTSDERLKYGIVDAPDAADLIDAIQVRSFKWINDDSEQRYGMIAQELVNVAPEAVHVPEDADEMMAVDYSKLVPMLVKEIQTLRARVAQIEG